MLSDERIANAVAMQNRNQEKKTSLSSPTRPGFAERRCLLFVSLIRCEHAPILLSVPGSIAMDVPAALKAFDHLCELLTFRLAAFEVDEIDDGSRQSNEQSQEPERRPDLPVGVNDGADNDGPKDAGSLVCNGIQRIEGGLGPGRDELAKEGSTVRAETAQDETVDGSQRIHFPRLLETDHPPFLNEGQIAQQTIKGNHLEKGNTPQDGLVRFEVEMPRDKRPTQGTDNAGRGRDDIDEAQCPGFHTKLSLGE